MKKTLAFILALVLVLSVFAGVTAFADEQIEWSHELNFSTNGYGVDKLAEDITVSFWIVDWSWAFKEINGRLELDGKPVTGKIKANTAYTLVVSLKYSPYIDSYYGFTTLEKENVKLGKIAASNYYVEGEYCVAVFELTKLDTTYTSVEFCQTGYGIGVDKNGITVQSNTEGIKAKSVMFFKKDTADGYWKIYNGSIEKGGEYGLHIEFVTENNLDVAYDSKVTLLGAGKPIVINSVSSYANGGNVYMAFFPLPAPEEKPDEKLSCDMDGDGVITVTDALILLREAAHLTPAPKAKSVGPRNGDMDGDGKISVTDALMALRIAAKLA